MLIFAILIIHGLWIRSRATSASATVWTCFLHLGGFLDFLHLRVVHIVLELLSRISSASLTALGISPFAAEIGLLLLLGGLNVVALLVGRHGVEVSNLNVMARVHITSHGITL